MKSFYLGLLLFLAANVSWLLLNILNHAILIWPVTGNTGIYVLFWCHFVATLLFKVYKSKSIGDLVSFAAGAGFADATLFLGRHGNEYFSSVLAIISIPFLAILAISTVGGLAAGWFVLALSKIYVTWSSKV
jgi:hypothetical protein